MKKLILVASSLFILSRGSALQAMEFKKELREDAEQEARTIQTIRLAELKRKWHASANQEQLELLRGMYFHKDSQNLSKKYKQSDEQE